MARASARKSLHRPTICCFPLMLCFDGCCLSRPIARRWSRARLSASSRLRSRSPTDYRNFLVVATPKLWDWAREGRGVIPYNPKLMQKCSDGFRQTWGEMERDRLAVYRDVLPWLGPARAQAINDEAERKRLHQRADQQWQELLGLPPLTSIENWVVVQATATAAGYPPTRAGLRAWAFAQTQKTKAPAEVVANRIAREVASANKPGPDSPTGFLGGVALAKALGVHPTQRILPKTDAPANELGG